MTTLKSGRKGELKSSTPAKTSARAALLDQTEKLAALVEIDMEKQRPPSLITPDEADGRVGVPGPSSDMFSPGALKSIMVATTAANPQGLSPGTLNELGNLLQSPASVLASARKTRPQDAEIDSGGATAPAPADL